MKKRIALLFFFSLVTCSNANDVAGFRARYELNLAKKAFESKEYDEARRHYEKVFNKISGKVTRLEGIDSILGIIKCASINNKTLKKNLTESIKPYLDLYSNEVIEKNIKDITLIRSLARAYDLLGMYNEGIAVLQGSLTPERELKNIQVFKLILLYNELLRKHEKSPGEIYDVISKYEPLLENNGDKSFEKYSKLKRNLEKQLACGNWKKTLILAQEAFNAGNYEDSRNHYKAVFQSIPEKVTLHEGMNATFNLLQNASMNNVLMDAELRQQVSTQLDLLSSAIQSKAERDVSLVSSLARAYDYLEMSEKSIAILQESLSHEYATTNSYVVNLIFVYNELLRKWGREDERYNTMSKYESLLKNNGDKSFETYVALKRNLGEQAERDQWLKKHGLAVEFSTLGAYEDSREYYKEVFSHIPEKITLREGMNTALGLLQNASTNNALMDADLHQQVATQLDVFSNATQSGEKRDASLVRSLARAYDYLKMPEKAFTVLQASLKPEYISANSDAMNLLFVYSELLKKQGRSGEVYDVFIKYEPLLKNNGDESFKKYSSVKEHLEQQYHRDSWKKTLKLAQDALTGERYTEAQAHYKILFQRIPEKITLHEGMRATISLLQNASTNNVILDEELIERIKVHLAEFSNTIQGEEKRDVFLVNSLARAYDYLEMSDKALAVLQNSLVAEYVTTNSYVVNLVFVYNELLKKLGRENEVYDIVLKYESLLENNGDESFKTYTTLKQNLEQQAARDNWKKTLMLAQEAFNAGNYEDSRNHYKAVFQSIPEKVTLHEGMNATFNLLQNASMNNVLMDAELRQQVSTQLDLLSSAIQSKAERNVSLVSSLARAYDYLEMSEKSIAILQESLSPEYATTNSYVVNLIFVYNELLKKQGRDDEIYQMMLKHEPLLEKNGDKSFEAYSALKQNMEQQVARDNWEKTLILAQESYSTGAYKDARSYYKIVFERIPEKVTLREGMNAALGLLQNASTNSMMLDKNLRDRIKDYLTECSNAIQQEAEKNVSLIASLAQAYDYIGMFNAAITNYMDFINRSIADGRFTGLDKFLSSKAIKELKQNNPGKWNEVNDLLLKYVLEISNPTRLDMAYRTFVKNDMDAQKISLRMGRVLDARIPDENYPAERMLHEEFLYHRMMFLEGEYENIVTRSRKCIESYAGDRSNPHLWELLHLRIDCLKKLGHFEDAKTLLTETLNPTNSLSNADVIRFIKDYLDILGEEGNTQKVYDIILSYEPLFKNENAALAEYYLLKGSWQKRLRKGGHNDSFEKAFALGSPSVSTKSALHLGSDALKTGNHHDAKKYYESIIKRIPDKGINHENALKAIIGLMDSASLKSLDNETTKKVHSYLEKLAIKIKDDTIPDTPFVNNLLAQAYDKLGMWDKSIATYFTSINQSIQAGKRPDFKRLLSSKAIRQIEKKDPEKYKALKTLIYDEVLKISSPEHIFSAYRALNGSAWKSTARAIYAQMETLLNTRSATEERKPEEIIREEHFFAQMLMTEKQYDKLLERTQNISMPPGEIEKERQKEYFLLKLYAGNAWIYKGQKEQGETILDEAFVEAKKYPEVFSYVGMHIAKEFENSDPHKMYKMIEKVVEAEPSPISRDAQEAHIYLMAREMRRADLQTAQHHANILKTTLVEQPKNREEEKIYWSSQYMQDLIKQVKQPKGEPRENIRDKYKNRPLFRFVKNLRIKRENL